jgi:hypothetical protein
LHAEGRAGLAAFLPIDDDVEAAALGAAGGSRVKTTLLPPEFSAERSSRAPVGKMLDCAGVAPPLTRTGSSPYTTPRGAGSTVNTTCCLPSV